MCQHLCTLFLPQLKLLRLLALPQSNQVNAYKVSLQFPLQTGCTRKCCILTFPTAELWTLGYAMFWPLHAKPRNPLSETGWGQRPAGSPALISPLVVFLGQRHHTPALTPGFWNTVRRGRHGKRRRCAEHLCVTEIRNTFCKLDTLKSILGCDTMAAVFTHR